MIGESLWSNGTLGLRDLPSPYYSVLTPALIGAPLAWLDLGDGIQWARLLQALAASLVAVPTYLWARSIASMRWALAAAGLVLLAPALHYAGFLMTEPLTLTVVTVALLAMARALQRPRCGATASSPPGRRPPPPCGSRRSSCSPRSSPPPCSTRSPRATGSACGRCCSSAASPSGSRSPSPSLVVVFGGELSTSACSAPTRRSARAHRWSLAPSAIAWHAFDVALLGFGVAVLATAALAARCSRVATRIRRCARSWP